MLALIERILSPSTEIFVHLDLSTGVDANTRIVKVVEEKTKGVGRLVGTCR